MVIGEYAEDFGLLEVASRKFRMEKVNLVGMVDIVDNMAMVGGPSGQQRYILYIKISVMDKWRNGASCH